MTNNVRQKVRDRLRVFLASLADEIRANDTLRAAIAAAQTDYQTARKLSTETRKAIEGQLPGCRIVFTMHFVQVYLPDRYPHHKIPIVEDAPMVLIPMIRPKGLSNAPFWNGE